MHFNLLFNCRWCGHVLVLQCGYFIKLGLPVLAAKPRILLTCRAEWINCISEMCDNIIVLSTNSLGKFTAAVQIPLFGLIFCHTNEIGKFSLCDSYLGSWFSLLLFFFILKQWWTMKTRKRLKKCILVLFSELRSTAVKLEFLVRKPSRQERTWIVMVIDTNLYDHCF